MILLEANQLKIYVKDRLLIDAEQLRIQAGDRIGLGGRNGSGKTTLLEVLAGVREPSEGIVSSTATCELLPQLKETNTTKSGGEVTQDYINQSLAKKTDILLADEPTTNLDTSHIEKLEKQLQRWQGALVIVSHDRAFLDALCTTIWEIDEGKITAYKGNYTDYTKQKEQEIRQQQEAYEQYTQKKRQLEQALKLKEQKAQRATKKPKKVSSSEAKITGAKPYFANKQKKLRQSAKAMETRLEKLEKVEKVKETAPVKMAFPDQETLHGKVVLRAEDAEGKINERVLWHPTTFHIKGGDHLAIIGNNGSGKTTLLKKMISEQPGFTLSPAVKIGYFSQNLDILDPVRTILENVSTTSSQSETFIRTVLARLHLFREDVYKEVKLLSGGERVKVGLAKLFVSDINTLILDEPTNFLDIEALEALEELLAGYPGTILLVSHDRRFIEHIAERVLVIEQQEIGLFEGSYSDYKQAGAPEERDVAEEELMVVETRLSEVLGKLSIEPTDELEEEFQELLARKRDLRG
ncbi:Vga family ABC-F type ribosomal protection protein [Lentibacillus sediminis]|uniref:Vga family ABC-F type ribosomal protection protein n=1 Tax=Lentibacillus sediminis TaxID=1940529 RepID=UPI000C1B8E4F|nr:Vga family ABC-F type ribosomal protection protein [Lentibacillus sediminis]